MYVRGTDVACSSLIRHDPEYALRYAVRIWIRKEPSREQPFEGFDLHLFDFVRGETVEVAERLAEMLLLWDYAAPERRGERRWITNGLSRRAAF